MNNHFTRLRGFTLLEMLIVLVLMSFLIVLLMQGLSYINQLTSRVSRAVKTYEDRAIRSQWLIQILSGLYPVGWRQVGVVKGTSLRLEAVTLRSLQQPEGVPVPFELQVDKSTQTLNYVESGMRSEESVSVPIWNLAVSRSATSSASMSSQPSGVASENGDKVGEESILAQEGSWQFKYQSFHGEWFTQWPPVNRVSRDQKNYPLPQAICWCHPSQKGVLAAIASRKFPPFDTRDGLDN